MGSAESVSAAEPKRSMFGFSFTYVRTALATANEESKKLVGPDKSVFILGSLPVKRSGEGIADTLGLLGAGENFEFGVTYGDAYDFGFVGTQ